MNQRRSHHRTKNTECQQRAFCINNHWVFPLVDAPLCPCQVGTASGHKVEHSYVIGW
ncbi:Uncharacterised protein [Vibrio cholerae]|nr:Uncharacterised protein [Vibrio cholerae]